VEVGGDLGIEEHLVGAAGVRRASFGELRAVDGVAIPAVGRRQGQDGHVEIGAAFRSLWHQEHPGGETGLLDVRQGGDRVEVELGLDAQVRVDEEVAGGGRLDHAGIGGLCPASARRGGEHHGDGEREQHGRGQRASRATTPLAPRPDPR
jgi:hypothetical protein